MSNSTGTRALLDHVAADDACVVRSAGGEEDDSAELLDVLAGHVEPLEDEGSMANSIADRLGDGLGLLEDLLEHEGLEARFLGAFVVPVELDGLVLGQGAIGVLEAAPSGRSSTISPSPGNCTLRVSRRNAAAFDARNISSEPIPTTSGT